MLMISESLPPRTEETMIRTFTGRKFWPLNPAPEDLDILDIAHALSLVCRFTGHTRSFYSVADHSLRVSVRAEKIAMDEWRNNPYSTTQSRIAFCRDVALWGLLHDASEAYLCDVPSPLKHFSDMGNIYRGYEKRLLEVIAQRYDLLPVEPAYVHIADRLFLEAEMRDLMGQGKVVVSIGSIMPLSSQTAETLFLRRFHALTSARDAERKAKAAGL